MAKKWIRNDQKLTKNWPKNDQKMTKKWPKNDHKMIKKWPKNEPKNEQQKTIKLIKTGGIVASKHANTTISFFFFALKQVATEIGQPRWRWRKQSQSVSGSRNLRAHSTRPWLLWKSRYQRKWNTIKYNNAANLSMYTYSAINIYLYIYIHKLVGLMKTIWITIITIDYSDNGIQLK